MSLTNLPASLPGMALLCLLSSAVFSQNPIPNQNYPSTQTQAFVFGKIMDSATGKPIGGASLRIKGSRTGTLSTDSGSFVLPAAGAVTVIVSVSGYVDKTVVLSPGQTSFNIFLRNQEKELGEVVVVGYGKEKKATLTGSVATISGDEMQLSTAPNITNALAGRAPGLIVSNFTGEPGADDAQILVRGFSTLGDSGPLFVIDGVANRTGFSNLNPRDIESISILKDASAAIYGAQAANGVILVTTKRGKSGKPVLTYNGSYSISNPTRVPKLVNAYEYAIFRDEKDVRMGLQPTFSQAQIDLYKAGTDPLNYPSTNWYSAVMKPRSPQTSHTLSLSGGSDRIKYYLSGQYLFQDGFYRNSAASFREYNLHSALDAQVTNNFKLSVDVNGQIGQTYSTNNNAGTIFLNILGIYPGLAPYYPNGFKQAGLQGENPLQMAEGDDGYNNNTNNRVQTTVSFDWKLPFIVKGLSLSGFAANDYAFYNGKAFYHPFDLYRYDSTNKVYNNVRDLLGVTTLNENYGSSHLGTYNLKLNYDGRFGDHEVHVFAAAEESDYYNEGISAYRRNYISTQIDQIFAGSNASTDKDNGGTADQNARQNYFGRFNYSYKEKYLLEFVVRHDGSFNFPPDKRWGTFPGISAAWRLSEEPFFRKAAPWVTQLKLKGSYSVLGNDRIPQYQYLTTYAFDYGYYTGTGSNPTAVQGLTPGVVPNPDITWETDRNANVGLEASLWNGGLDVTFEYYKARRDHILTYPSTVIPTSAGMNLPQENIGIVDRHGVEITMGRHGTVGRDFRYGVTGNISLTQNVVVYAAEPASTPAWQKMAGHPFNTFVLYQSAGLFRTQQDLDNSPHLPGAQVGDIKYVDYDKNGVITANDMYRSKYGTTPLTVYGITLDAAYKGFSLNVLLAGQARSANIIVPQSNNVEIIPPKWVYDSRWTAQNPNASQPAPFDRTYAPDNQASTFYLYNTAFMRLKSVELGYNFKEGMLRGVGISTLRAYVNGLNLFTIDKVKYYDPEINSYSGAYYPQTRILTCGLTASF